LTKPSQRGFAIYTNQHAFPHQSFIFVFMEVNSALVEKIANLSRLHFNEAEKESIKTDLQRMIQFVEKLNELDTTGVEPLLHMSANVNVLREDEQKGSISTEEALKNAPVHDNEFFKVPKVISKQL
jgi:aspartyl-tRNA(Asn)/glutamyl-tRNA(Gln) amidotransferase subunit C